MIDRQICPICGKGEVVREIISETFWFKGFPRKVDNYVIFTCPVCHESIVDDESVKRVEKILREFHIEVNKKVNQVAHICFNTQDERGWCIREYPKLLCNLCFGRNDGIDLNEEQFEKFNKKTSKNISDIILDISNGKEIWIYIWPYGFQKIKKIIIKESNIHKINHYGTSMYVENRSYEDDGERVTEIQVIPQP